MRHQERDALHSCGRRMADADGALELELEASGFRRMMLCDPLRPSTWRVELASGATLTLHEAATKPSFLSVFSQASKPGAMALISVAQESDGQHCFVRMSDALAGKPLTLLPEVDVKKLGAPLLYARAGKHGAAGEGGGGGADFAGLVKDDLAPHQNFTNYSVVPWLCLGRTQRVLLSDERTLTAEHPSERIMRHVSLVVNCHEERCDASKYKVGQDVSGGAKVITEAVHKWYGGGSTVEKNHAIQAAMWEHLQGGGSVAVHCLAGIHRAACIVACHFLYRHHVLGHAHVPGDTDDIYRKLQSVRPHVSPACAPPPRQQPPPPPSPLPRPFRPPSRTRARKSGAGPRASQRAES